MVLLTLPAFPERKADAKYSNANFLRNKFFQETFARARSRAAASGRW